MEKEIEAFAKLEKSEPLEELHSPMEHRFEDFLEPSKPMYRCT
jgi:hypothetical protein